MVSSFGSCENVSMRINVRLDVRRGAKYENENDIDCEQEEKTFVRRVATAETGNLVPLGPPRSRYLCRGRSISIWIDRNCQKKVRVLKKVQYWRVAVSSVGQSSPPTVVLNSFVLPSSVTWQKWYKVSFLGHKIGAPVNCHKSDIKCHLWTQPPLSPPQCQRGRGGEAAGNDDQHQRQAWRVKMVTKQSIFCKPTQTKHKVQHPYIIFVVCTCLQQPVGSNVGDNQLSEAGHVREGSC